MTTFSTSCTLLWFFALLTGGANAQACSCEYSTSLEMTDGSSITYRDYNLVGGISNVDKIIKVEVYAGNYFTNYVVTQLCTTYLRRTGGTMEPVCNGNGGSLVGTVDVPEGHYISKADLLTGKHIDYISFTLTNGETSEKFGGKTDISPNFVLQKSDSAILSFFGKSGAVMDRIYAVYETNRLLNVRQPELNYEQMSPPKYTDNLRFDDPNAIEIVINDSSIAQSSEIEISSSATSSETFTLTKSQEFSVGIETSFAPGKIISAVSADVMTTVSIGSSFSTSYEASNTVEESTAVSRSATVVAPPSSTVTAELFYSTIEYEYNFTAPVLCSFSFDPDTEFDGEPFEGTVKGKSPLNIGYVRFTEDEQLPVTSAPVTSAPVDAPIGPMGMLTSAPVTTVPATSAPVDAPIASTPQPNPAPVPTQAPTRIGAPSAESGAYEYRFFFGLLPVIAWLVDL